MAHSKRLNNLLYLILTNISQAPKRLLYMLDGSEESVEVLLRLVNLLANLTCTASTHRLNPTVDLPAEDKAASPDTM